MRGRESRAWLAERGASGDTDVTGGDGAPDVLARFSQLENAPRELRWRECGRFACVGEAAGG